MFLPCVSLSLLKNNPHLLQGSHGGKFSSCCLTALPSPRTLPMEVTFPAALLFLTLALIKKNRVGARGSIWDRLLLPPVNDRGGFTFLGWSSGSTDPAGISHRNDSTGCQCHPCRRRQTSLLHLSCRNDQVLMGFLNHH